MSFCGHGEDQIRRCRLTGRQTDVTILDDSWVLLSLCLQVQALVNELNFKVHTMEISVLIGRER